MTATTITNQVLEGHAFTFTIGRGNELCVEAIRPLAPLVRGLTLDAVIADRVKVWSAAVVNAMWDLWAKYANKPLWKLLADMPAEDFVRCVNVRYITDALTPDEALAMLRRNHASRTEREDRLRQHGYPAYTTPAGWLGYTDDQLRQLCRDGLADGWSHFKPKVGGNLRGRRCVG
jgi:L-fuconate dehydratase